MKLIAAEQKGAHSHIENKDFFPSDYLKPKVNKKKMGSFFNNFSLSKMF